MQTTGNDLHDWYMAFLRKHAQESSRTREYTPRRLIQADRELLEQLIEKDVVEEKPRAGRKIQGKLVPAICIGLAVIATPMAVLNLSVQPLSSALLLMSLCSLYLAYSILLGKNTLASELQSSMSRHKFELQNKSNETDTNTEAYVIQAMSELFWKLDQMQQKESLIFDYCPYILCKLNQERKIVDLNENAQSFWGYAKGELIGLSLEELLVEPGKKQFLESLEHGRESHEVAESEQIVKTKTGDLLDLSWRAEWSNAASAYFCLAEDISSEKENERLKKEIATMVNHDLRTPISGLIFWTDNMLSGIYGQVSESMEQSLRRMAPYLKGLLSLLDNMLALEKLEAGGMKTESQRVKVNDVFEQSQEFFLDWFKNAQLTLDVSQTDLVVKSDVQLLHRLLGNFVSNAIKWSPKGSTIWLRARAEDKFAVIEVEDSGPGVPAELRDSLFQRWNSIAPLVQKDSASFGLGLFISRKFAELQGGTTGMKPSERGGSIFWVSLPLWE